MVKRIVEKWWHVFGVHIYLRLTPDEFEADLQEVCKLVDAVNRDGVVAYPAAKEAIERAYKRWSIDHELVRLHTLAAFEAESC